MLNFHASCAHAGIPCTHAGEYNCFLNVVIQSLWHLRPFRDALLGMTLPSAALSPDIKVRLLTRV